MQTDLEIFNNLYGDDDELVFQALSAKKDWMFIKSLYVKGHINIKKDDKGLIHYPFIESMLDDTLLFEDFKVINEEVTDQAKEARDCCPVGAISIEEETEN